jgi:DNA recombination protein RmuC
MFIPAEAVFAEIHARFPELVEQAHRLSVWLVSPTTMMAVLTTARAVLRDQATREQVHLIRRHLTDLSSDFGRFQERMDRLARHIQQAHRDVDEVSSSARRITGRFEKIERVELAGDPATEGLAAPAAAPPAPKADSAVSAGGL